MGHVCLDTTHHENLLLNCWLAVTDAVAAAALLVSVQATWAHGADTDSDRAVLKYLSVYAS